MIFAGFYGLAAIVAFVLLLWDSSKYRDVCLKELGPHFWGSIFWPGTLLIFIVIFVEEQTREWRAAHKETKPLGEIIIARKRQEKTDKET